MAHRTVTRNAHFAFVGAVGFALILPQGTHAQNLPALARERALRNPGTTMEQPSVPHHYTSKTLEELSGESDVVVQGKLIRVRSYLGEAEDRILTDFRLVEPRVIAGQLASPQSERPGPGTPITIGVWGGEVTIEGVKVRSSDVNLAPIVEGQDYLLFLRQDRAKTPGRYEIYYGGIFEASGTRVNPLLKKGEEIFPEVRFATLQDVRSRVQAAKRRPSER